MRELLYLSVAKMRSFSLDAPQQFFPSREVEVKVLGETGLRVGASGEPAAECDKELLERVLHQLEKSPRSPRDITHPALGPGDWAVFESEVKFGHFHRDKAKVTYRVVLFRGTLPEDPYQSFGDHVPPPEPAGTDFLLGGWIGHMIDKGTLGDWSVRMGSATDDIYSLWSEVAELDREGRSHIPREFGHLAEIESSQDGESLAEVIRSIYGMGTWEDPTAHADMQVELPTYEVSPAC
jgi:hypothetical protein